MKKVIIIFIALLSSTSYADFFRVNQLKENCFRDGKYHEGLCYGYIMGIYDGTRLMEKSLRDGKYSICLPAKTNSDKLKTVVMELIESKDIDSLQNNASDTVWRALLQEFPCS